MSKVEVTFFSQAEMIAAGALEMQDAVEALEEVYVLHGFQDYVMPAGAVVRFGGPDSEKSIGRMSAAPAYIGGKVGVVGVHWSATLPQNPVRFGLPVQAGLVLLSDPATGLPVALMDDTLVTSARLGAEAGLAARYLANPGSRVIGLIGAGGEAYAQLLALQAVLPAAAQLVIWDSEERRIQALTTHLGSRPGWDIQIADSLSEAARAADLLLLAAAWERPVVEAEWLKEGVLCHQSGAHGVGLDLVNRCDKLIVDDWGLMKNQGSHSLAHLHRQNLLPEERIHALLGEVVTGQKSGRESERELILFCSAGLPMADIGIATRIMRNARAKGIGTKLTLREDS